MGQGTAGQAPSTPAWSAHPESFDARAGDLLAVVELDPLQAVAALQVFQRCVCDEGAVVQLNHLQLVMCTGPVPQVADAIICDKLAVGQTLQAEQRISVHCQEGTLPGLSLRNMVPSLNPCMTE